uniref:Uncharacterized protein n=1 Tax=Rhizophagus irregularis (strain DAOM 181602 / DAOM 197198 / MUCL 43194) TaxID=747089 RepID=U9UI37_RHIID
MNVETGLIQIGSERQKARDLRIRVEYFDKFVKLLMNRLIDYLNFINHKDKFSTFKGALSVDLYKTKRTPSGTPISIIEIVTNNDFGYLSDRQTSVEAILNTPSYSLQLFLSVNEGKRISMLKAAINSLSAHVWHSINSLIKDSISQEVAQRYQLRFLVSMVQSYRTLELLCALKPHKQVYDRVQSIKQAYENNGVEIQQPNEMDFSFDY